MVDASEFLTDSGTGVKWGKLGRTLVLSPLFALFSGLIAVIVSVGSAWSELTEPLDNALSSLVSAVTSIPIEAGGWIPSATFGPAWSVVSETIPGTNLAGGVYLFGFDLLAVFVGMAAVLATYYLIATATGWFTE